MTDKLKGLKKLSREEQAEQIMALAAGEGISLTEDDFRQFDGKKTHRYGIGADCRWKKVPGNNR